MNQFLKKVCQFISYEEWRIKAITYTSKSFQGKLTKIRKGAVNTSLFS